MQRVSNNKLPLLSVRQCAGDFTDHSTGRLHEVACCCSCCLQMPVGAACGLLAAPLLLGIGYIPGRHRPRWPLWIRFIGMGVLLGGIEGTLALVLWIEWTNHMAVYLAGCLTPLCVTLPMAWRAIIADQPYREVLGRPSSTKRSMVVVSVLSVALGSLAVSAVFDFGWAMPGSVVRLLIVSLAAAVGGLVAFRLVRSDQGGGFTHPEPHIERLAGALVGANLAATIPTFMLEPIEHSADWLMIALIGTGGLIGGLWSTSRCRAKNRARRPTQWRSWTGLVIVGDVFVFGMAVIAGHVLWWNLGSDRLWYGASMLAGAAVWLALCFLSRNESLCAVMESEDRPLVCPSCAYNLTGLPQPRCPECGRVFEESQLRQARRYVPFPVTFWHPACTSPVAGALVGLWLGILLSVLLD